MCYDVFKSAVARIESLCHRRKKAHKLQISAPFNFKKEDTMLPGISDDEISVLREKAIASRIGISAADVPRRRPSARGPVTYNPVSPVDKETVI